jgi:hypothetical protein
MAAGHQCCAREFSSFDGLPQDSCKRGGGKGAEGAVAVDPKRLGPEPRDRWLRLRIDSASVHL